jgi:hypothetical protein
MTESNKNAPSSASGVTYSILAGMSAASASVFGKLAVDPTVIHRFVHYVDFDPSVLEKVSSCIIFM